LQAFDLIADRDFSHSFNVQSPPQYHCIKNIRIQGLKACEAP
jgi:hypothetical protein